MEASDCAVLAMKDEMDSGSGDVNTKNTTLEDPLEPVGDVVDVVEQLKSEVEAEPDGVDNQQTDMDAEEEKTFDVSYKCLPDMDDPLEDDVGKLTRLHSTALQYLDVLLQTDAHGVGLNVGLGSLDDSDRVLVVTSFRRLSETDVGPAEACGKIRMGDILHSIDGEEVSSLQQLHSKLKSRLGTPRKFVLLRFLRPVTATENAKPFSRADLRHRPVSSSVACSGVDEAVAKNPELAVLIRQLATTNRLLQDQLVESKLKQEEQSIQLDQLHALYARTQAEALPLFSLSKSIRPFSRRPNASDATDFTAGKLIPSKIQMEVVDAVNAEYARLRQDFQMQLMVHKRELEQTYAERTRQLQEATDKKVEMLEAGFQAAVEHVSHDQRCCGCCVTTHPRGVTHKCRFLQTGRERKPFAEADTNRRKLQHVIAVLTEYESKKRQQGTKLDTSTAVETIATGSKEL